MQLGVGEATAAMTDTVDEVRYGSAYFGRSRGKTGQGGTVSGYAQYHRASSRLDVAAYLLWRFLPDGRSLDVGCALGFLVEALRDLGEDAIGVEYSDYAARHAAPGAAGYVLQGDLLAGLPFRDSWFDIVTAFEVLEHLPPDQIPDAIRELRRVCRGWVVITVPSIGLNEHGPDGFLERKVRDEELDRYYALGPEYQGPVAYDDLYRDVSGNPIEGHLTIASFTWWTRQFEAAGFARCGEMEARIHPQIRRFGLATLWNLYVFRLPGQPISSPHLRTPEQIEQAEKTLPFLREQPQPDPPPSRYLPSN
jgi:SAM-dependent methyltransferase